jgi:hypothetical protein
MTLISACDFFLPDFLLMTCVGLEEGIVLALGDEALVLQYWGGFGSLLLAQHPHPTNTLPFFCLTLLKGY